LKHAMLFLALGWVAAPGAFGDDLDPLPACPTPPLLEAQAAPAAAARPPVASAGYDNDLDTDPAEPDFTVIDLPTNLRVPKHRIAFRLTHRFARPLGDGSFSDLAADFFGFDAAAQIGFGLRFGLFHGSQLGIYRTSNRTIQLHLQQELLRRAQSPVGLSVVGSVEGLDNFGLSAEPQPPPLHEFSPSIALVLSRQLGTRGAVYAEPSWVGHTRVDPSAPGTDDSTLVLGLGARLRVTRTMSFVGEYHPRLAGYEGDLGSGATESVATFGIEGRVGGHSFQLNFSNALGTTPAQIARGQQGRAGWFIGFNLTRKFF
jgi:Membrane bound beta barrel domain (DUF5777)